MKPQNIRTRQALVFLLPFLFLLGSCIGVSADITLNQNGSGTLVLEYRISRSLDSLGRLDGNERWNTVPVGRADFERTMNRLPEMKLLSFTSKEDETDLVITAKMEFSRIEGLLAFLDASGRRSAFSGDAGSGRLALSLSEGLVNNNAALDKLIADISESYLVKMSMTFPGEGSLNITDNQGRALAAVSGTETRSKGKKVFCSFPLYDILSSTEGVQVEFVW